MRRTVIVDTGILVAYLNREEKDHAWAKEQLDEISPPLLSCEAVIAESCFLLRKVEHGVARLLDLLQPGRFFFLFVLQMKKKTFTR